MKSLWEKASEIGSRAKNIATVYLGTEKEGIVENQDHIKTAEKSEKSLDEAKDLDNITNITTIQEASTNVKVSFDEKEKNYILHINQLEKTIDLKNLQIEKLVRSIKEIEDKMEESKFSFRQR